MNERQIIELLAGMNGTGPKGLCRGIGDDCAVIRKDSRRVWLITVDTLVESVHFDLSWHPPEELGRKTVSVNVSDIAAMGGEPVYAFLSLGLPGEFDSGWLKRFASGLSGACAGYGCRLAGGDTVRTMSGVMLSLTVIGEAEAGQVLLRSGALPGDAVWVSGVLGSSAAGLDLCRAGLQEERWGELVRAHLDPAARLELGQILARSGTVHCMMDLSDGLATDLSHICRQSGAGASISPELLPSAPPLFDAAAALGRDALEWMLKGGEDYELLFTAPEDQASRIRSISLQTGIPLTRIGRIDDREGVRLAVRSDGQKTVEQDLSYTGFDHFTSGGE